LISWYFSENPEISRIWRLAKRSLNGPGGWSIELLDSVRIVWSWIGSSSFVSCYLSRIQWSQVKMSVSVYLKTHRFLEGEAWPNGVLSLPMIWLEGDLSSDWTLCFSRISLMRSLELEAWSRFELEVASRFSSSAFFEASSAESLIALASSFNSWKQIKFK